MKDTRVLLDDVRAKIPPTAKVLVCWIDDSNVMHASQANVSQSDVVRIAESLTHNVQTMPSGILRASHA
jgi:hypothetical protein